MNVNYRLQTFSSLPTKDNAEVALPFGNTRRISNKANHDRRMQLWTQEMVRLEKPMSATEVPNPNSVREQVTRLLLELSPKYLCSLSYQIHV